MVPITGVGDLAVVVTLSAQVLQILRSAVHSAPGEIHDLVRYVEMLDTVLQSMRSALEDHGEIPPQRANVMCSLELVLRRCEDTLVGLRTIGDEYGQVLRTSNAVPPDEDSRCRLWQDALNRGFLRLKWPTTSDLTAELCTRINQHFTALNVTTSALQMFAPLCPSLVKFF